MVELKSTIKGSDEGFRGGQAREEAGILGRNDDPPLAHQVQELLAVVLAAVGEESLRTPKSINAETKIRLPARNRHGFVDGPALHLGNLTLIVRVADVKMLVRDHKDVPLFSRN